MKSFLILFTLIVKLVSQSTFEQISMTSPTEYRTIQGKAGRKYWQQKVDYKMKIDLDTKTQSIKGQAEIQYHNNSPDNLEFIWFQLDQNKRQKDSWFKKIRKLNYLPNDQDISFQNYQKHLKTSLFEGGMEIKSLRKGSVDLKYLINGTVMRVDLPNLLESGASITLQVEWAYRINDIEVEGRSGYELLKTDSSYHFYVAQFYPRAAVYSDIHGWETNQFIEQGEFNLEFGDYEVAITIPDNYVVAASGLLTNENAVLSNEQLRRLNVQRKNNRPSYIISPDEAEQNGQKQSRLKKTWNFKANSVRDFAFAASKRFIWDAATVQSKKNSVLAMSFYLKESIPLWNTYSTHAIIHTLEAYSKYTFEYPYPTAVSVSVPDNFGGMEYPMITFNGYRPQKDGTYSLETKEGLIGVIIHEIGHSWFPMIINSNERQWAWMDEGFNSFISYLVEREWNPDFNSMSGPVTLIANYLASDENQALMTAPDALINLGENAYNKTAAGLVILRETIMGRVLFDKAFKTYCERWKFKRPTPMDFFRTMEDVGGMDLDWFWRQWFYQARYVDQSISNVELYQVDNRDSRRFLNDLASKKSQTITDKRNSISDGGYEKRNKVIDYYSFHNPYEHTALDSLNYSEYISSLNPEELHRIQNGYFHYKIQLENIGSKSAVMPVILKLIFEDSSSDIFRYPAEIWLKNERIQERELLLKKKIKKIILDPFNELPDMNRKNNVFPQEIESFYFYLYQDSQIIYGNPMQEDSLNQQLPHNE